MSDFHCYARCLRCRMKLHHLILILSLIYAVCPVRGARTNIKAMCWLYNHRGPGKPTAKCTAICSVVFEMTCSLPTGVTDELTDRRCRPYALLLAEGKLQTHLVLKGGKKWLNYVSFFFSQIVKW